MKDAKMQVSRMMVARTLSQTGKRIFWLLTFSLSCFMVLTLPFGWINGPTIERPSNNLMEALFWNRGGYSSNFLTYWNEGPSFSSKITVAEGEFECKLAHARGDTGDLWSIDYRRLNLRKKDQPDETVFLRIFKPELGQAGFLLSRDREFTAKYFPNQRLESNFAAGSPDFYCMQTVAKQDVSANRTFFWCQAFYTPYSNTLTIMHPIEKEDDKSPVFDVETGVCRKL
ncbi:MAG: hypothetical protein V5B60_09740 [Accumulibacter sp.]|jgi:hypothetical protein|uniref:hypothetical protein n=1 Tax=Accumulibacter sp. TaxID=2053492 RepID=UPI002FC2EAC1